MGLSIAGLTPSLLPLSEVKAHLNIDATDTSQDVELQGFINAAAAYVTYITGPIAPTTFTEVRNGGGSVIMLDNPPVLSITSVTEYYTPGGRPLTLQPLGSTTDAYGYDLVDPAAGKLVRRSSAGYEAPFLGGRDSVVIVYTAGLASVPADIRMALLEDIRGYYQPTQQGFRPGYGEGDETWQGKPMNAFPRLAAMLSGPSRTQSIG